MGSIRVRLGPNTRTVREWSHAGKAGWQANARSYAQRNGAAFVIKADGSGLLYYRERGKVRQKSFPRVVPYRG